MNDFLKKWSYILKELGQEAHDLFLAYLGMEMGIAKPSEAFAKGGEAFPDSEFKFKSGQELEYKTGRLYRSFNQRSKETLTNLNISNDIIELTVGSKVPYAEIQNKGGFIKTKGKMEKFFWYKFLKSGNPNYKIIALAVRKNGGVRIPKTEYFDRATEKMVKQGYVRIFNRLITELGQNVS